LKATRQIADEALYRGFASGGGGTPSVLPAASFLIYVMKGGNDATGNGTDEEPFLTVAKGLAFAHSLAPTFVQSALVLVGPGTFAEHVLMPPNVFLCGLDEGFATVIGTGAGTAIALTADWVGTTLAVGAIEALVVIGDVSIDLTGSIGGSAFSYGSQVDVIGSTTMTADPATSAGFSFFQAELQGPTTIVGGSVASLGTQFNGLVTFRSVAGRPIDVTSQGDIFAAGITLDASSGANATANLLDSGVSRPLTLINGNGGATSYTASMEGIPPNVSLVGGAGFPISSTDTGVPFDGAITTSDNGAHTIMTIPVPLNTTINVDYELIGRTTAGTVGDSQATKAAAAYKNVGGVVTQLTTHAVGVYELQYDATVNPAGVGLVTSPISGTNLVFQITGELAATIDWKMKAFVSFVS
jgi:hypothetical protein